MYYYWVTITGAYFATSCITIESRWRIFQSLVYYFRVTMAHISELHVLLLSQDGACFAATCNIIDSQWRIFNSFEYYYWLIMAHISQPRVVLLSHNGAYSTASYLITDSQWRKFHSCIISYAYCTALCTSTEYYFRFTMAHISQPRLLLLIHCNVYVTASCITAESQWRIFPCLVYHC